jgi:hypothetical protein
VTVPTVRLPHPSTYAPLTRGRTAMVALRSWWLVLAIWVGLRRHPLPEVVARLERPARPARHRFAPPRLGRTVGRILEVGPCRPRCLFRALVLYRLLRCQGEPVEVVLGLAVAIEGKDAHAWVEWAGNDVGPPPGAGRHVELARYG